MALTVFVFAKGEPRTEIHILCAGRLKLPEIQRRLCSECGHNALL
jgi:hypothetical protein